MRRWLVFALMVLPLVVSCRGPQDVLVMNSDLREVFQPDGRKVGVLAAVVENRTGDRVVVEYHVFLNGQFLAVSPNQQIFPQTANNQEFQIPLASGYNAVLLVANSTVNILPSNTRSFVVFAP
ncbi:MAG: hypothetical protein ACOX50_01515 [Patescibacteria group bacterium]|jgi:hypothetical protein